MTEIVLEVRSLVKHYPLKRAGGARHAVVHAVDGISLSLRSGETMALVGESGCGKSTLAKCIIRLVEPTSGEVYIAGRDFTALRGSGLRVARRVIQMVFQNPLASLNPRRTVFQTIADPLRLHDICGRREHRTAAKELLEHVGLGSEYLDRYPHELSGGQQQRVAIARALAVHPQVIICDEATSALDVSVQAQVINLLRHLQERFGLSYLFISHNLALARRFADKIGVMYLGQIVEWSERRSPARGLLHPYSRALFEAMPIPNPAVRRNRMAALPGEPPSPVDPPSGCRFYGRCAYAKEVCAADAPPLREVRGRLVRCHFAEIFDTEVQAAVVTGGEAAKVTRIVHAK